jgi:anti-sigma-K factor RskA
MDYSRPERADRLAAEYALGTLRGPARRRFEALLPAHPALRHAVAQWQWRLEPLVSSVADVQPPPRVWHAIERRLFGRAVVAQAPRWWQGLGLWRGISAFATIAALALLFTLNQVPPAQAPIIVVLAANPETAAALDASFVASVSPDGRALVLRPVRAVALPSGRALELWAVPPDGAPRSLGLVKQDGATTLLRTRLLDNTAAFAVSVEPQGGSPTGAPTGPIVSVGKLEI